MAIEKITMKAVEVAVKGLEKMKESLEKGEGLSKAFEKGMETLKNEGINSLKELFSPEQQKTFDEATEKIDDIQEKIEMSPAQEVLENKETIVKDFVDSKSEIETLKEVFEEKIQELADKIDDLSPQQKETLVGEFKEEFKEMVEVLKQIQEIKDKLESLGIHFNENGFIEDEELDEDGEGDDE